MGSLPAEIRVESVRCAGSWERERQGTGNEFPRPASRHPPVAISPRSSTWGDPGEEPGTAAPPDITTHGPCPGRGRGRSAEGAGGVGGPARYPGIPCRRRDRGGGGRQKCMGIPAKARAGWGHMDYGVWGAGDRGGGTSSPSPSAPPPVAISPRSTAWGDPGEEPGTAAPLISQALPPPPRRGRGRSAAGAGGVGADGRSVWVVCRRRRGRGGGAGEEYEPCWRRGYPPARPRS